MTRAVRGAELCHVVSLLGFGASSKYITTSSPMPPIFGQPRCFSIPITYDAMHMLEFVPRNAFANVKSVVDDVYPHLNQKGFDFVTHAAAIPSRSTSNRQ